MPHHSHRILALHSRSGPSLSFPPPAPVTKKGSAGSQPIQALDGGEVKEKGGMAETLKHFVLRSEARRLFRSFAKTARRLPTRFVWLKCSLFGRACISFGIRVAARLR